MSQMIKLSSVKIMFVSWLKKDIPLRKAESQLMMDGVIVKTSPSFIKFLSQMMEHDQLWSFLSPASPWENEGAAIGYCIVRNGEVIDNWLLPNHLRSSRLH